MNCFTGDDVVIIQNEDNRLILGGDLVQQVRLDRLYPGAIWKQTERTLLVPLPPEGTNLATWLCELLTGCAAVRPQAAFEDVRQTVAERAPYRVVWATGSAEDAAARVAVDSLLADSLTVEAAVQVALLNNRRLQATYEDLGVAQADLVQERTGLPLLVPDTIPITSPPTDDELVILRHRVNPHGHLLPRKASY